MSVYSHTIPCLYIINVPCSDIRHWSGSCTHRTIGCVIWVRRRGKGAWEVLLQQRRSRQWWRGQHKSPLRLLNEPRPWHPLKPPWPPSTHPSGWACGPVHNRKTVEPFYKGHSNKGQLYNEDTVCYSNHIGQPAGPQWCPLERGSTSNSSTKHTTAGKPAKGGLTW